MKFRNLSIWILIVTLGSFVTTPAFAIGSLKSNSKVCTDLKNQLYREQAIVNELIKQTKRDSRAFVNGSGFATTAASSVKTYLVSEINMIKIALKKSSCFTPAKVAAVRSRLTETSELYKLFGKIDINSSGMKTALKAFSDIEASNFAKLLYQN